MAAADGRVSFVGWQKGFGRIVILKHPGGYKTYYGHLSRFAKGIKKGIRVEQKQIIGYVGSSGIKENGVFKNPFNMKFKPKSRLSGKALDDYIEEQGEWGQVLKNNSAPKTLQVETQKIVSCFVSCLQGHKCLCLGTSYRAFNKGWRGRGDNSQHI
jgi:hypothetical protein